MEILGRTLSVTDRVGYKNARGGGKLLRGNSLTVAISLVAGNMKFEAGYTAVVKELNKIKDPKKREEQSEIQLLAIHRAIQLSYEDAVEAGLTAIANAYLGLLSK